MTQQIRRNIVALLALQGSNYVLPLVTIPYLLRVLGPENFGRVAFAQAFIQYFLVVTDYGFNLTATRTVAKSRNDAEALSVFASTVMTIKSALMLLGFLAMIGIVWLIPEWRSDWSLFAFAYLSVLGGVLFPVWIFQGIEHMRHIALFSILSRLAVVTAIFLLVHESSDYRLAAGLQAASTAIAGALALWALPKLIKIRWHWPGIREIRVVVKDGWHVFISNFAVTLYTSSNIFFLGLLTNASVVGYFAAAEKLLKAVHGLVLPISQAVYPHIAALTVQSRESALAFIGKVLRLQGSMTLLMSMLLFLAAEPLVLLLFGYRFEPCVVLVRWMAPLPFLIGLSNIFGIQTMLNFDMTSEFSRTLIASGLLNTVLIFTLVPILNAEGAAISVLITELAVTTIMAAILLRRGLLHHIFMNGSKQT